MRRFALAAAVLAASASHAECLYSDGPQPDAGAVAAEGKPASFPDFDARAKAGEALTVVFFGGSLTWSANATDPNVTGFRGLVARRLAAKYPKARFRFVDASLGGTGSNLGMFRLERDVLSKRPDLVFLDFACNDGGENANLAPTCCYEYLLRQIVGRGIPVVQMFFTFKFWAKNLDGAEAAHARLVPYGRLADAYSTGVGSVYRDCGLMPDLKSGRVSLDDVWPIDGGHPDDIGYRYFADAGMRGFERAVGDGLVCRVPERPVFGTVKDVKRVDPARGRLPDGWRRALTYRTSLWYDGLSSRWMDDVAAFSGKSRSPLVVSAEGNFFGVFGEADENALTADVLCDGKKISSFNGYHRAGPGRLFIWRNAMLDNWADGAGGVHEFAVDPIPSGNPKGEFRIGSICTATIVPVAAGEKSAGDGGASLEKLDHGRGK